MIAVKEDVVRAIVAIIDNAVHPGLSFSQIAMVRQALLTSSKVENGDSTDTADSKASN